MGAFRLSCTTRAVSQSVVSCEERWWRPGRGVGWAGVVAYKEAMDVGEEDGQLAARPQQLRILYGWHEVAAVWATGCGAGHGSIVSDWVDKWRAGRLGMDGDRCACVGIWVLLGCQWQRSGPLMKRLVDSRSPVDLGVLPIVDNLLNNLKVERLGQVLLDQGDPFLGGHRCHGGQV